MLCPQYIRKPQGGKRILEMERLFFGGQQPCGGRTSGKPADPVASQPGTLSPCRNGAPAAPRDCDPSLGNVP